MLAETSALVRRRSGMEALRVFDEDVLPVVSIHWVGETDHGAGMAAVLAANRRRLSLVDCVSFEAMRVAGPRRALALDNDFREQGFEVLP